MPARQKGEEKVMMTGTDHYHNLIKCTSDMYIRHHGSENVILSREKLTDTFA